MLSVIPSGAVLQAKRGTSVSTAAERQPCAMPHESDPDHNGINSPLRSYPYCSNSTCTTGGPMFEGLFQPMHLLMIFGIALLVFGPKKLPELGKGLGESIRGFKSAMAAQDEPVAIPAANKPEKSS